MQLLKLALTGALAAAAGLAQAAPMIRITDGTTMNTVTVVDGISGSCGDTISTSGVVGLNCSIGSWWMNFVIGVGRDVLGNSIQLDSMNFGSSASGTLTVALTDTNFVNSGGPLNFLGTIVGNAQGTVNYWMYVSDANTPFGTDTLIGSGSVSGGLFTNTFSNLAPVAGSYSMTLVATITHSANFPQMTNINFDGEVVGRVPEPATLGLLGIGLAGIGFAARRLNRR